MTCGGGEQMFQFHFRWTLSKVYFKVLIKQLAYQTILICLDRKGFSKSISAPSLVFFYRPQRPACTPVLYQGPLYILLVIVQRHWKNGGKPRKGKIVLHTAITAKCPKNLFITASSMHISIRRWKFVLTNRVLY